MWDGTWRRFGRWRDLLEPIDLDAIGQPRRTAPPIEKIRPELSIILGTCFVRVVDFRIARLESV